MLFFIKRIIQHMKEIARMLWTICFPAFIALILGMVQVLIFLEGKSYQKSVLILLASLALLCLTIGIIMLIYDFKHGKYRHYKL